MVLGTTWQSFDANRRFAICQCMPIESVMFDFLWQFYKVLIKYGMEKNSDSCACKALDFGKVT